jgi:peptidoglycan/LPS O-acetylase OafA/YrhL
MTVAPAPRKHNNFGALRLLFASVVILSHSPEIIDGDRHRELLTTIFGTLSFGTVGVDGFFIISGYLITKSFLSSPTLFDYFKRRVLRIYPGFVVTFWICLLLVAPFVGAGLSVFHPEAIVSNLARMAVLLPPRAPGAFHEMPYPALNGSMWTIAYEFRCYILVAVVGSIGAFQGKFRYVLLAGVVGLLIMSGLGVEREARGVAPAILGSPDQDIALTGMFGAGMMYYLFRNHVIYNSAVLVGAAVVLFLALFFAPLSDIALALFGGYMIFWFAFKYKVLLISRFANRTDLSYGIYLYAWPIQSTIAHLDRSINPWVLSAITLPLSAAAAYLSWTFVEKAPLALAHRGSLRNLPPPTQIEESRAGIRSRKAV